MKDVTGDSIVAGNANWVFSGEVAQHFDDHVSKSVPLYDAGHELICGVSDFFIGNGSVAYELGCSTGTLSFRLAERNKSKTGARFVGIDIEAEMVAKAIEKRAEKGLDNVSFIADDIFQAELEPADATALVEEVRERSVEVAKGWEVYQVGREAGNWRNDYPELLSPVTADGADEAALQLF